jgi:hypothetical protein
VPISQERVLSMTYMAFKGKGVSFWYSGAHSIIMTHRRVCIVSDCLMTPAGSFMGGSLRWRHLRDTTIRIDAVTVSACCSLSLSLSLSLSVCVCACEHECMCLFGCLRAYVRACMSVPDHACVCVCVCVCVWRKLLVSNMVCKCMHSCILVCVCIRMYMYVYV